LADPPKAIFAPNFLGIRVRPAVERAEILSKNTRVVIVGYAANT